MNYCPCCTDILLRHTKGNGVYWFCRTCWQVMPVSEYKKSDLLTDQSLVSLSQVINKLENKLEKANSLTTAQKIDNKSSITSGLDAKEIVEVSS